MKTIESGSGAEEVVVVKRQRSSVPRRRPLGMPMIIALVLGVPEVDRAEDVVTGLCGEKRPRHRDRGGGERRRQPPGSPSKVDFHSARRGRRVGVCEGEQNLLRFAGTLEQAQPEGSSRACIHFARGVERGTALRFEPDERFDREGVRRHFPPITRQGTIRQVIRERARGEGPRREVRAGRDRRRFHRRDRADLRVAPGTRSTSTNDSRIRARVLPSGRGSPARVRRGHSDSGR